MDVIQALLETAIGIVLGITVGLIPGLHFNTMIPFLALLDISPAFVIAMSIAFVFATTFPSTLVGIPNSDNVLAMLPNHKMYVRGMALKAILISNRAMLYALMACIVLLALLFSVSRTYASLRMLFPIVLGVIVLSMVKNIQSLMIVVLSAALGVMTFEHYMLLPLLTGFFGMSNLLSFHNTEGKFKQRLNKEQASNFSQFEVAMASISAAFTSMFFSLVPAISTGVVATVTDRLGYKKGHEKIAVMSASAMAYMVFSFFTLSLLGLTRSGSAVLLTKFGTPDIIVITLVSVVSGLASYALCNKIAMRTVRFYDGLKADKLRGVVALFLIALVYYSTGAYGLLVLSASTMIGRLSMRLGVKRINCMAALIIPTLLVIM